jgi:UDPglucose 6-dehydrogenase
MWRAARDIGGMLAQKDSYHVVVVKSTVTPTTTENVVKTILELESGKEAGKDFGLAVNPEFLKEGKAVDDFMNPDRVVIGALDERSSYKVLELYSSFRCQKLVVPLSTAEMVKAASNVFLATKISFVNELGNLCKDMGIDVRQVAEGMGMDARIGRQFLRAGCGFGGSCLPKDTSGLIAEAKKRGTGSHLMEATLQVNNEQPQRLLHLLDKHINVRSKHIAVLGLAFKPFTDDIREASSLKIIKGLLERGACIRCHDPKAMRNFSRVYPELTYCSSPAECIEGADAVLIVTEWPEYSDPSLYGDILVVDGRGSVNTANYEGICW